MVPGRDIKPKVCRPDMNKSYVIVSSVECIVFLTMQCHCYSMVYRMTVSICEVLA